MGGSAMASEANKFHRIKLGATILIIYGSISEGKNEKKGSLIDIEPLPIAH